MKFDKYYIAMMNKREVIEIIRTRGPINRAEIAKITGLSIPTIMKIVDGFISHNLIRIVGKRESTGGKRPELFEFVNDARYAVGVDFGRNCITVLIMDQGANVITEERLITGACLPAERLINRTIDAINRLIGATDIPKDSILGIGVAMPGILDKKNGRVLFSPDFGWEDIPIHEYFSNAFDMPIYIENSNRTMALGERWYGVGEEADYLLCINLGYGIGAAILDNGELYAGSSGTSGEIGHMNIIDGGPECHCGNKGCLEAIASGYAIARDAKEAIRTGEETLLVDMVPDIEMIEAKTVFEAAQKNDKLSTTLIGNASRYIGIAIASCINLLDPDIIVLSGGLTYSGNAFLEAIKETVVMYQMKSAGRHTRIIYGKLGRNASAIGGATILIRKFIDNGAYL